MVIYCQEFTTPQFKENINLIDVLSTVESELRQFWDLKLVPEKQSHISDEDQLIDNIFINSHTRKSEKKMYC